VRLVLHIGGAKCGSTAIQGVLRENAATLRSLAVLVPGLALDLESPVHGHQVRFLAKTVDLADGPEVVNRRLWTLRRHMDDSGLKTLVVSAENLINQNKYPQLFAGAERIFDEVRIIAYVRRQDDYFTSGWQQWGLKAYPSMRAYLDARIGKEADWSAQLLPWDHLFGRESIVVRRFQRSALVNRDVVADFFSVADLPLDQCSRSEDLYNPSWDENIGMLAHRVRDVFTSQHDDRFFRDFFFAGGPSLYKNYAGSILLTLDERREILDLYTASNEQLRTRYFLDLDSDESLFESPSQDDVVEVTELEQLRRQQDVLVRAILGLVNRVRVLEADARKRNDAGAGA
jgi:hypothetical protein